ncbi:hypothetical protein L195_g055697, partial [Trifolium pratense]
EPIIGVDILYDEEQAHVHNDSGADFHEDNTIGIHDNTYSNEPKATHQAVRILERVSAEKNDKEMDNSMDNTSISSDEFNDDNTIVIHDFVPNNLQGQMVERDGNEMDPDMLELISDSVEEVVAETQTILQTPALPQVVLDDMEKIKQAWETKTSTNTEEEVSFTPYVSKKTKKQNLRIARSLGSYPTRSRGPPPRYSP